MRLDIVMRGKDVGLLLGEKLPNGQGQLLFERVLIGLFGLIFALLRGFEKGVVAATQLRFQVSPDAMDGAGGGSGLLDVVLAEAMQFVFELCSEVGALQAFSEEVSLELIVLQVLADIGEALLAVLQGVDQRGENTLGLMQLCFIGSLIAPCYF